MSKGTVNKVIFIGRLGQDPESRLTPNGNAVTNFSIATNRSYKDKEGNQKEETDWHNIVAWSRTAEIVKEYCRKGSRVYIEGRLQTRDWEDQNGQKRYATEVVVQELQLLDSKGDSANGTPSTPPTHAEAAAESADEKVMGGKGVQDDPVPF